MKIVISTAVYHPMTNGVAVFSHNLATGLAQKGHQVLVLCPSLNGKNQVKTEEKVKVARLKSIKIPVYPDQISPIPPKKHFLGIDWPHLFYKNGFRVSVFPAREVKKLLDKFCPDIIHCQVSDPIGLSVVSYAKKNHIPVVTTEHNQPDVITDPLKLPKPVKKPVDAMLNAYFINRQKHSDYVTMPTEKSIQDLLSHSKNFPIPVEAVSNGVDLSAFTPGKPQKSLFEKYHIPETSQIALYVGRLDPEKQVGLALEAFAKASQKLPEAIFVIVGEGVDRPHLENLAQELKISEKVIFTGRIYPPELYEIYKIGDVFITASEIETQGIVLIEAAATGLPLIAVDKGAVSEIVKTEENGYLCEPKNIPELAAALEKILQNPDLQAKFSKNSLKLAQPHDLKNTIKKFEEIYEKLLTR